MRIKKIRFGNKEVMPFTIPSGIISTEASSLERLAKEIPEIGILTTKSITPEPRLGHREPVLAQYAQNSFINAVGLTNQGMEEFARSLDRLKIPDDKFLLISIAGTTPDEFRQLTKKLSPYADGLELNLSCPNVKQGGLQIGNDSRIVRETVSTVTSLTNKPVFVKLAPNLANIVETAMAAIEAGANGLTAINTKGPEEYKFEGYDVLTNKKGGKSGREIITLGLSCVQKLADNFSNIPIIACGGIFSVNDVLAYENAGASAFGIGSALAMMKDSELRQYFSTLIRDLEDGTNNTSNLIKKVNMEYRKFRVTDRYDLADDFHVLVMDCSFEAQAGQFLFAWLPEKGEKPFSILETTPLKIAFSEKGCFTKDFAKLKPKDEIYFRGPYGISPEIPKNSKVALVGGGCGIAGINLFAENPNIEQVFIGAKDIDHLIIPRKPNDPNMLFLATEDGSAGHKGLVTDLLSIYHNADFFINCGPEAMVKAAIEIESQLTFPERIYSSIDYMTRCGVGLCGSCANEQGLRTCVEGPFMSNKKS